MSICVSPPIWLLSLGQRIAILSQNSKICQIRIPTASVGKMLVEAEL